MKITMKKKDFKIPKRIVLSTLLAKVDLCICIIGLILLILNMCIFDNDILRGFILGIQLIALLNSMVISKVSNNNFRVDLFEFEENMKKLRTEFELDSEEDESDDSK